MNLEALLAPVTPDRPCGENLEYDADYMAMDQASAGKAEQQFGDTIIPAEPADWNKVERLALDLLGRSKDLRVMLALTRAWTQLRGLSGYADGLQLIQQALLLYWQPLWPSLEEDGVEDPFYRLNALAALGDKSALTGALRQAPLLRYATDEISLRDACALLDGSKTECSGYPGGRARLQDELARGGQPGIEAVIKISERLLTIRETLTEQLGATALPEMEQLLKTINTVAAGCQATDLNTLIPQTETAASSATPPPAAQLHADWRSVQLGSRSDAQLMLEKVKQYFSQHEPSHPAPLMIGRVQRMIELDFMDIIRDLAPDGVHQLETIFGRRDHS
ncbi:type VI secretion system protein TssA [Erwinia pyrifoliae]|uniref:Type VI secretion system protein TssA n=1 Tax=Erwinia pyrifoliae TaxID=79967 RepID=A0ABY5X684_ERWPY|nr:type VI secretion system protein TssA [Erwinia pyrifoliae]AUX73795.1 type VI secretion system protein TssA [Erwinia pyrifoliae]MCA8875883.1 type VI secretion system protein TssA [Erwinia pyrifoliae]MCT2387681.1 type VI secretion system protein TssA [Erwinia pyrifoliae]MCU8585937.1 type VI secretion system protein TssA [Erwinia pyrifoliae]UWS32911.1 type VI secretion system protein TssA [Erwinia pyrifoliae]